MKEFDLNKALNGAKVVTRSGDDIQELTLFENANHFSECLVGVCNGRLLTFYDNGRFILTEDHKHDLFLKD
jgi:hypothetical protein